MRALLTRETGHYLLMLAPGIVLIAIFNLTPMAGIVLAFKQFNPVKGIWGSSWAGFEQFSYVIHSPDSVRILANTVIIAVSKMVLGLIVPVVFALMLNELRIRWFARSVQTIVYLPHFLSWVLIAGMIRDMFSLDGVINHMLGFIGIPQTMFMGSNLWFRPIVVSTDIWKEFGFSAIVYLAALTSINPSLYEAAEIDGASRMRKLRSVTLPGMASTMVLLAALSLQNVLNAGFDQIFNLYNPLVYRTGDIIDTYVYRIGLQQAQYEIATAIGLMKSAVSFFLIAVTYWLAGKFANYRIF